MASMIPFFANAVFTFMICDELSCIDQGNPLLIITNTMNITAILQLSNYVHYVLKKLIYQFSYFSMIKKCFQNQVYRSFLCIKSIIHLC